MKGRVSANPSERRSQPTALDSRDVCRSYGAYRLEADEIGLNPCVLFVKVFLSRTWASSVLGTHDC